MAKILISLPDPVARRMRAIVPDRQRSRFISRLVEAELVRREEDLLQVAREVETDETLSSEMKEWDGTVGDGVNHESW